MAGSWSARVGWTLTGTVLLVALLGPLAAPNEPASIVGIPFSDPTSAFPLGTDYLGRDVLSRLLHGGWTVIALGSASTLIAYLVGAAIGLTAGTIRGRVDGALMRATDVVLAFPPLLVLLVLATGAGAGATTVVLGVALVQVPAVARVIRAATLEVSVRGYVEAAYARGESQWFIVAREVVPNITATISADAGPRLTVSILLIAGLNFLGLGLQPPAADWALMITENRPGLTFAPVAVAAPALMLALLTVGVNLCADALARRSGQVIDAETLRR
ncbi:MAG: ABC transporter permease [Thermoleophilaceae bacterium]